MHGSGQLWQARPAPPGCPVPTGLDILIATTGIVEIQNQEETPTHPVNYVVPKEETLKWVYRLNAGVAMLWPHYEPIIVPPRQWTGADVRQMPSPLTVAKCRPSARIAKGVRRPDRMRPPASFNDSAALREYARDRNCVRQAGYWLFAFQVRQCKSALPSPP